MWPFKKKSNKKQDEVQVKRQPIFRNEIHTSTDYVRPAATRIHLEQQRDSGSDFATGFLVGEALSGGCPEAGLIGGALGGVMGGVIGAEIAGDCHHESSTPEPAPVETHSTPDSSSCDTSSSFSDSSSSSSCDSSSSFDSGSSSSGSDF